MDLSPKWIIENNRIILGKVSFHHQLSENYELKTIEEKAPFIAGGGWFRYQEEDNSFLFYALSTDFGQCTLEQVQAAYQNGVDAPRQANRYSDHPIRFSTCLKLEDALNNNILLTK